MKLYLSFISFCLITCHVISQEIEDDLGMYNFVENGGQWPEGVLFKANIPGGKIWLENRGVLYQFHDFGNHNHANFDLEDEKHEAEQHLIYANFKGANSNCLIETQYPSKAYYNYFIGQDKSKWAENNHAFGRIKYADLYKGIDLVFFEKNEELKYEYHVQPQANYRQIEIQYGGQDKIRKLRNGNIIVYSSLGQIIEQKPYVYQIKNGKVLEIESEFILSTDNILSFKLGDYDSKIELIIDPILVFATYSGSPTDNFGMTATYAYDGKAYSAGTTYGSSYPTPGPAWNTVSTIPELNASSANAVSTGITDVFVSKYSEDGTTMIWTNIIGGGTNMDGTETVHSLICDRDNNVYLYGATSSVDFPIVNGLQSTHAGGTANSNYLFNGVNYNGQGTDIYVAKFSENGLNLLGSTYMGGSGNDGLNYKISSGTYGNIAAYDSLTSNYGDQFRGEIMLDSLNNIIIASSTRSSDFPILNAFQTSNAGQQDGVIFKLASNFSSLLWSSYFGGSENDACYSVKVDSSYNILIAGGTSSNDLPNTVGGLNPSYNGGKTDGFVAKISADGNTLIQASYIGTSTYDQVIFVEIDRWDNVFLVGVTDGNMPVQNANYSNPNSGQFIMKLNPDLDVIEYATVFGNGSGTPDISLSAFLVDVCGNVYVSGWGANILQANLLTGMPVTSDAFQATSPNGFDFYLFVLERDAESMLYGSYIGGSSAQEHVDGGTSRFDKNGVVYQSVCGGCGGNSDFPTSTGAWSSTNDANNCNNLLFKFDFENCTSG